MRIRSAYVQSLRLLRLGPCAKSAKFRNVASFGAALATLNLTLTAFRLGGAICAQAIVNGEFGACRIATMKYDT